MMRMTSEKYVLFILIFAPLLNFGAGIVVDLYAPSLPEILKSLSTTETMVQATIVSSIIGYAIGQLFFGVLSDWKGRKFSLILGIVLFSLVSLSSFFASNIEMLIVFRFIQGLATGSCQVTARAIISDKLKGNTFNIAVIYLSVAFAAGLILGPYIGVIVQHYFNWRFNFLVYFGYGILVLILSLFYMKESLAHDSVNLPRKTLSNIFVILKNKEFTSSMIQLGCCFFCFTLWNQVGPIIVSKVLNKEPTYFANIALLTGLSYLFGTLLNRLLIKKIVLENRIYIGATLSIIGVLLITLSGNSFNVIYLIAGLMLTTFAQGVSFPNVLSRAILLFSNMAGLSASLQGAGMLLIGFIGLSSVSLISVNSGYILAIPYFIFIAIFIVIQLLLTKKLKP